MIRDASRTRKSALAIMATPMLLALVIWPVLAGTAVESSLSSANPNGYLEGGDSAFSFVSWGDAQALTTNFSNTANQVKTLNPAFTIFNGDLEEQGYAVSEMDLLVSVLKNANLFDQTFMVRGNHDNIKDNSDFNWENFFETAPNIRIPPAGITNYVSLNSSSDTLTYSFDFGNSRFIGVDVPGDADLITSTELTFVNNRLADAECTGLTHAFLFWHGPIYCNTSDNCTCSLANDSSCTPNSIINLINNHPIVSATFHGHSHILGWTHMSSARLSSLTHEYEQFMSSPSGGSNYYSMLYPARMDYAYTGDSQGFALISVNGLSFTYDVYTTGNSTPVWSRTFTKEIEPTLTPSLTPTSTATATQTFTPTATSTKTRTPTASATKTRTPTATFTLTTTKTFTPTATATFTSTPVVTDTFTPTATATSSLVPTATFTSSPTTIPTDALTPTATPTLAAATNTFTPTIIATNSFTPTATLPSIATVTNTPTPTLISTPPPTATNTFTPTASATDTRTPTATSTPTATATSANTAGPSPTNTPFPIGPGTFDDSNPSFIYAGSWNIYSAPEPYHGGLHYTTTQGAAATTTISGSWFILVYTCNTNRGLVDIFVDNVKVGTLNQYSASLTWRCTWNSPSLGYGVHTIKFVHASPSTTYYMDIDAIIIPDVVPPATFFTPTETPTYTPIP